MPPTISSHPQIIAALNRDLNKISIAALRFRDFGNTEAQNMLQAIYITLTPIFVYLELPLSTNWYTHTKYSVILWFSLGIAQAVKDKVNHHSYS